MTLLGKSEVVPLRSDKSLFLFLKGNTNKPLVATHQDNFIKTSLKLGEILKNNTSLLP